MQDLNFQLFHWVAAGFHPNPWLLDLARAVAIGGGWVAAVVVAWLAWRRPTQRAYLVALVMAVAATALLSHTIAAAIGMPRPFVQGLSPAYIAHGPSGSLPSTHAATMFAAALAFALRRGLRDWAIPMVALAAFTGWARVYVGVHFPQDIAAGLLLGGLVAVALASLQRLIDRVAPTAGKRPKTS